MGKPNTRLSNLFAVLVPSLKSWTCFKQSSQPFLRFPVQCGSAILAKHFYGGPWEYCSRTVVSSWLFACPHYNKCFVFLKRNGLCALLRLGRAYPQTHPNDVWLYKELSPKFFLLEHRKIEGRDLRSHKQRRAVCQISKELLEEAAVQKSHESSVKQNLVVKALPKGWLMWDFQKLQLGKC